MKENLSAYLPLSPAARHILSSLAGEDLHGYAIMQQVRRHSGGHYNLRPGTLYDNLQRLVERRLVQEMGPQPGDDDPRRRYYRLSALGRAVLAAEVDRLENVLRQTRLRLQAAAARRA